ncbi:MAG: hypothetical protein WCO63_14145 [Bacteroidota bacterium]
MKKKLLIIVFIVVGLAAAIFIAAIYLPKINSDQAAGTIGKAEKLRKGQFTTEDIMLRDDILKDTAAVGRTLEQVLSFGSFMKQQKIIIDSLWIKEIQKNCPIDPSCSACANCQKATQVLKDYSSFLGNNLPVVKATCEILLAAYNGKKQDLSGDVGFKMLSFVQLVDELVKRDSVLNTAIKYVDEYISKDNASGQKQKEQLIRMKQIRDHMVLENLMFAVKTGDKKHGKIAASHTLLSSGEYLNDVLTGKDIDNIGFEFKNDGPLGSFMNEGNLSSFMNDGNLSSSLNDGSRRPLSSLVYVTANEKLDGGGRLRNSESNQLNLMNRVIGANVIYGTPLGIFDAYRIDAALFNSSLFQSTVGPVSASGKLDMMIFINMNVVNSTVGISAINTGQQLNSTPLEVALNSSLQPAYNGSQSVGIYGSHVESIFNTENLHMILSNEHN